MVRPSHEIHVYDKMPKYSVVHAFSRLGHMQATLIVNLHTRNDPIIDNSRLHNAMRSRYQAEYWVQGPSRGKGSGEIETFSWSCAPSRDCTCSNINLCK